AGCIRTGEPVEGTERGGTAMQIDDLILVSVDDHVVEPADLFERHLPERWRDRSPRVVRAPNGADVWMWGEQHGANFGLNAVAGRPPEEYGMNPISFAQIPHTSSPPHTPARA